MKRGPEFACPGCGYDVRSLLEEGVERCPECGRAISVEMCHWQSRHFTKVGWVRTCMAVAPSLILMSVGPMFDTRWPTRQWTIPLRFIQWWLAGLLVWCVVWSALYFGACSPRAWGRVQRMLSTAMGAIILVFVNFLMCLVWLFVFGFGCLVVDWCRG